MTNGLDADFVLNAFLRRYLADSEADERRSCEAYQRLFPGHEDLIAGEYARLLGVASDRDEPRFGRYRLLRELGRGGQGVVHLAVDTKLDRQVALKVLTGVAAFSGDVLKRFRREAEVASRIDHAGVCSVFDAGEIARTPFIAMRYVDGETLAQTIAAASAPPGPAAIAGIVETIEKAARALQAAHQAGVLHRDVKPGNVMLTRQGEPVLLDFGLARALEGDSDGLTRTGESFGTPSYMAPEQVSGGALDARTDVYGLGASLYEALTLRRPFEEPTREKLYHAICTRRPVPPSRHNPAVRGDLEIVLGCALEADPGRRYETAFAFAEDLRRVRAFEPIHARPTGPLVHFSRWARRNPALAAAVGALLVLLVGGLALTLVLLRDARNERDSKNTALGLVERLSDVKRLEDLHAEAEGLWPADPSTVPRMRAWLDRAEALSRALPGHRGALAKLRSNGRMTSSGAVETWSFPSTEQQWHHDTLARLVRDLEAFLSTTPPAGVAAAVHARMEFAETVRRKTLEEPRGAWEETIAAASRSPKYAGLRISPQLGLVPLGPDPASGLFEFAHVQTGVPPERDAAGKLAIDARTAIVLVLVPGGRFRMGSPAGGHAATLPTDVVDPDPRDDEIPVHDVALDPFFISKYEMTQAQWVRVAGENPGPEEDPCCPLRHATYEECERTMTRLGLQVPTEAQWECAARGGTATRWWCGAEIRSVEGAGNVADQSIDGGASTWRRESWRDGYPATAPVGRFHANPFGVHDTIGNVWEFTRDHGGPYSVPPRKGDGLRVQGGEKHSDSRICRGGSYIYGALDARSARRSPSTTTGRSIYNGIRPARAIRPD